MKFNFRKIASVLASTVMLSSTVALAAAANYPSPFVKSGVADVAVVYGSTAAQTDLVAATDITTSLNSKLVTAGAATSISGGDFVKLEKSTNMFNLGEDMNDFYSTLDEDQLSIVLNTGIYMNDANEEFDYDQQIALGALNLTHFQDNDFNDEKPVIGFDLAQGDHILNYTLDFTPDSADCGDFGLSSTVDDDCETTDITMLGRSYYVVKTESTSNGVKLTLLDTANSQTITEGETSSITVKGSGYDVSIEFIDEDEVILNVNGVTTNKLTEGDVFKVGTDLYVGVKNVLYNAKESGISKVEVSLGSGKIVMEHGQEVELNNEDVSDITDSVLNAYIRNSSTEIDNIVLEWNLDDDAWLAPGSDLVFPGFETIKLSMGGFITPSKEWTSLDSSEGGDSIKLTTYVTDGKVSFNLLYSNATQTGFAGLGKDANSKLITSNTTSLGFDGDTDDWFVATWISGDDSESYVLKLDSIDDSDPSKNTTSLKSAATDSAKGITLDIGETDEIGEISLTLNAANENLDTFNITASAAGGSGSVSLNRLVTKEGLKIQLPIFTAGPNSGDGYIVINATNNPTTFTMNFTEEDEDGNIDSGESFTAGLGFTSDNEIQVSSVSVTDYESEDGSDLLIGYVESPLATRTEYDTSGDPDSLDIEYHGAEAYGEVYISETGAALVTEGGAKILPVTDSEAPSAKNLVVVGGSCVNSVAASLLGGALCGADFEAKTGVGAGSFLIETFARDGGAVATLVAGYNAEDTTNAAKYLTTQTVDTTVGKMYKGTSATAATLVVA